MAREPAPPKGIQKIIKRNADSESVFFRVRMQKSKESFSIDRLFDTLPITIAFLNQCKTLEGRAAVMAGTDNVSQDLQYTQIATAAAATQPALDTEALRAGLISDSVKALIGGKYLTVRDAIESYSRVHILPFLPNEGISRKSLKAIRKEYPDLDKWKKAEQAAAHTTAVRENDRENAKKRQRQLALIANIQLPYVSPEKRRGEVLAVGGFAKIAQQAQGTMIEFGDIPLVHVDKQTGRDLIEARSGKYHPRGSTAPRTRSVLTVQRDIVLMSAVFSHIEFATDLRNMWAVMGNSNPFSGVISKRHLAVKIKDGALAEPTQPDGDSLTPDKELMLLAALDEEAMRTRYTTATQHEPPIIFRLSLATGIRLSECVLLQWSYVDIAKRSLWLPKHATKSKARRRVILTDEAIDMLNSFPREGERLFKMSVAGLASAMFRVYKSERLKGIKFSWHDLRRAHITRMINNNPTLTPTQLAFITGDASTKRTRAAKEQVAEDRAYLTGSLTEPQMKKSWGHGIRGDMPLTYIQEAPAHINTTAKTAQTKKSRKST